MPNWRTKDGRFNRRGWFLAIQGQLVQKRGPGQGPQPRIRKPKPPRFYTKDGRLSKRGYYIKRRGKLVRFRGLRKPKPESVVGKPDLSPDIRAGPPSRVARDEVGIPAPTLDLGLTERKGATYKTYFRAKGTFGDITEESPQLLFDDVEEIGAPAAFYSNHGAILGQVRWDGIVPLETLIRRLNGALQYLGEETRGFDFREAYPSWSYGYRVIEFLGPSKRVVTLVEDAR